MLPLKAVTHSLKVFKTLLLDYRYLSPHGMMIVDNSDWLPATCLYLRRAGLIQVDFSGFVPGNPHTQTTSFFLTPEFNFEHRQKIIPVGGTGYNWERH